jgi:transposase
MTRSVSVSAGEAETASAVAPAVARVARVRRSKLERRRIVEESFVPGVSVARLTRAHAVNANQIFHWRSLYKRGRLDVDATGVELLPVRISDGRGGEASSALLPGAPAHQSGKATPGGAANGVIQIETGQVRVRIEGAADASTLRVVLESLRVCPSLPPKARKFCLGRAAQTATADGLRPCTDRLRSG